MPPTNHLQNPFLHNEPSKGAVVYVSPRMAHRRPKRFSVPRLSSHWLMISLIAVGTLVATGATALAIMKAHQQSLSKTSHSSSTTPAGSIAGVNGNSSTTSGGSGGSGSSGSASGGSAGTGGASGGTSSGTGSGSTGKSGGGGGGSAQGVAGPVGLVGCSNSRDTVIGYHADGGNKLWTVSDTAYGGGTVVSWSDLSSTYWHEFAQYLNAYPSTKTLWWSLCIHPPDQESDAASYSAALTVIGQLQKVIPGVTIYVSAINSYVAPHVCSLTGSDGPSRAQSLADRLVSEGRVKAGPAVGTLLSIYPTGTSTGANSSNNQTISDGCHPNTAGEALLGQSLVNFFGK